MGVPLSLIHTMTDQAQKTSDSVSSVEEEVVPFSVEAYTNKLLRKLHLNPENTAELSSSDHCDGLARKYAASPLSSSRYMVRCS